MLSNFHILPRLQTLLLDEANSMPTVMDREMSRRVSRAVSKVRFVSSVSPSLPPETSKGERTILVSDKSDFRVALKDRKFEQHIRTEIQEWKMCCKITILVSLSLASFGLMQREFDMIESCC